MRIGNNPGAFAWCGKNREDKYLRMKELGYQTADFGLGDTQNIVYSDMAALEAHCLAEKEAAAKAGIELFQVHGPWPTDDTTEESRREVWKHMHTAVYGCHLLGAPYLIIHPQMPFGWGAEADADFAEELTLGLLRDLIPDCEKYGVTICLENMPMKAHRISPMEKIVEAVAKISHPNIAICFDTGHSNVYGHDLGDMVRICAPWLKTLHIHDNGGAADHHQLPWLGTANWDSFLAALAEVGYDGSLSFETAGPVSGRMPAPVRRKAEELTAAAAIHMAETLENLKK